MRSFHARIALAATAVTLAATGALIPAISATADTGVVSMRLRAAIRNLPVAAETRTGYERTKFSDWVDADGDCRDTRDEVLATESRVAVHGCDVQVGNWRSYYDGAVTRDSTAFDIDHVVALAEAWDSGAKRWTASTRARYANDLGDRRTLVAVSASSNRSKSDRDPAEWMPQLAKCTYVRHWVAVKIRWSLKVNTAEKIALTRQAANCKNATIKVQRASIQTSR